MTKLAADVVLLPSKQMMEIVIAANRTLLKQCPDRIILDKEISQGLGSAGTLPHVSLAMGCIHKKNTAKIGEILQAIAERCSFEPLSAVGLRTETNSAGEQVTVIQIERTAKLQSLHEEVMSKLADFFSYEVSADMLLTDATPSESTLLWIKNYPKQSSFENFSPHITIGYGRLDSLPFGSHKADFFPLEFSVSELALCHLGNHCTCKKILFSAKLQN